MGVSDGERYGTSVIDFGEKALWEEAVGVRESGGNNVWEGPLDVSGKRVGCWGVPDGIEPTGRIGEGGGGFCSCVFCSGHVAGRGLLALTPRRGPGGAGRLSVGGEVFGSELGVEGGRGED